MVIFFIKNMFVFKYLAFRKVANKLNAHKTVEKSNFSYERRI